MRSAVAEKFWMKASPPQEPGVGVAKLEVKVIGCAAVPTALSPPAAVGVDPRVRPELGN